MVYLNIKYPITYKHIILKYSEEYDVDPCLIASIINVESRYDAKATSRKEAKGLMQITPGTGQWASEIIGIDDYDEEILYDPDTNIRIGTWYIDRLLVEFNQDLDLALAAYNAGSGNVSKWLEDESCSDDGETLKRIPFKETEGYLIKVHKNYKVYNRIHGKKFKDNHKRSANYMGIFHSIKGRLN